MGENEKVTVKASGHRCHRNVIGRRAMSSNEGLLSRGLHTTSNALSQNFVQDANLNFSGIAHEQVCYFSGKFSKDSETNRNTTVSNKKQDYLITIHVIIITLLHYFRDRNLLTGVPRKHFKFYCVKKKPY